MEQKTQIEILRPFGPSIAKVKIPENLLNDLNKYVDEVIVYDSNGCQDADSITLHAPDLLVIETLSYPDTCARGVGSVDVTTFGGVYPYEYLWSEGQTDEDVVDLLEGINIIQVLDDNNCIITDSIMIEGLLKPIPEFNTMPNRKRYFDQLDDPIVFIDMTECYWQRVVDWAWDFDYDGITPNYSAYDSITTHVYNKQGVFDVLLRVTTEYNCIDTITHQVLIDEYVLSFKL